MSKEYRALTDSHKAAQLVISFDRSWLKRVDLVEKIFIYGFYVFFVLFLINIDSDSGRSILRSVPFITFAVCYCIFSTLNLGWSLVVWFCERVTRPDTTPTATTGKSNAQINSCKSSDAPPTASATPRRPDDSSSPVG